MHTYLLGLTIACLALLTILGFIIYNRLTGGKLINNFERRVLIIAAIILFLVATTSGLLVWYDDLLHATIIVWMTAIPVLVAGLFILLIILFKPGWR